MKYKVGDILVYEDSKNYKWIAEIVSERFGFCPGDLLPKRYYNGKLTILIRGKDGRLKTESTRTTGCWNMRNEDLRPINSKEIDVSGLINILSSED